MANDINNLVIVGRLIRDVELSYTSNNNTALAKFGIAVNESRGKDKDDEVSFFDVVVWGKMAEICNQYISKGRQVIINGRLKQDRFQDKQGQNRSKVSIIANNVQFVGGKKDSQPKDDNAGFDTQYSEDDVPF